MQRQWKLCSTLIEPSQNSTQQNRSPCVLHSVRWWWWWWWWWWMNEWVMSITKTVIFTRLLRNYISITAYIATTVLFTLISLICSITPSDWMLDVWCSLQSNDYVITVMITITMIIWLADLCGKTSVDNTMRNTSESCTDCYHREHQHLVKSQNQSAITVTSLIMITITITTIIIE